jgi:cephalosporin hydroxylase
MVAAMYGHPCAYPACLSPSQGRQLREIVLERKPREILEIGCFMGVSSLWIASALEEIGGEGRLHSIDLFEPILPWPPHRYGYLGKPEVLAKTAAYVAGLDHRIRFHRMNSFDLADRYDGMIGRPVDFAFIDGDHTVEGCLHDVLTIAPHVRPGGTLLLHDTNPAFCGWDGPRYVLDRYLIPSPYFRVTEIETEPWNFGMAMIEKLEEVPSPDFGWRLRMFRTRWRSRLVRTPLWQSVRGTPLGKLVLDAVRR